MPTAESPPTASTPIRRQLADESHQLLPSQGNSLLTRTPGGRGGGVVRVQQTREHPFPRVCGPSVVEGLPMPASGPRVLFNHQLQKKRKPRRRPPAIGRPEMSIKVILSWADTFHARTGRWPKPASGRIPESDGDNWMAVQNSLIRGHRGLPKSGTLIQLLAQHRGVRNIKNLPRLTIPQILSWADAFHERTGGWPQYTSGPIPKTNHETWSAVESALRDGRRGLRKGSSLAQLLTKHRGVRNIANLPNLTVRQILAWADAFHRQTGQWPKHDSESIPDNLDGSWCAVDTSLREGYRGLPKCGSLARLLAQHRGIRNNLGVPQLTVQQILAWADSHHRRTGQWPTGKSGPVFNAAGENWSALNVALQGGGRGLQRGSSLAQVLAEHRRVRNRMDSPPLEVTKVLRWMDAFHRRNGQWPRVVDGPITDAPGETWVAVDATLRQGRRGLPGGSSLARLLAEHRGVRNSASLPKLSAEMILKWADVHYARTGRWPKRGSGAISEAPGETWLDVDAALSGGRRGLSGRSTLLRFLKKHRRV